MFHKLTLIILAYFTLMVGLATAISLEHLDISSFAIRNATPEEVEISVTMSNQAGVLTNSQAKIPAGMISSIINQNNEPIKEVIFDHPYYHIIFLGYDPIRNSYVFSTAARTLKPEPRYLNFDYEVENDFYYPYVLYSAYGISQQILNNIIFPAELLAFYKKLFDKKPLHVLPRSLRTVAGKKIPRILHLCCFEPSDPKIDQLLNQQIENFRQYHAGWQVQCWREPDIQKIFPRGLANQALFDEAKQQKNYDKMSIIAGYEILNACGGLWLTPAMHCIKSFDYLHNRYDFYVGMQPFEKGCCCMIDVIGTRAGHPIIKKCIELVAMNHTRSVNLGLCQCIDPADVEQVQMMITTGMGPLTMAVLEKAGQQGNDDIVLPASFFYPRERACLPRSFCYKGS